MNKNIKFLISIIIFIGIIYISPNFFGLVIYKQPSFSMEPTISQGEHIVVSYWAYDDNLPERHDVVAYESNDGLKRIGRIIALPGERIEFINSTVYINEKKQIEPFVKMESLHSQSQQFEGVVVEESHFFIMGDNRNRSRDSRFLGTIGIDKIIGKMIKKF